MKKILLLNAFLLIIAATGYSQISFGVRGGLNFNKIQIIETANNNYEINYDPGMGFHFGLTSQLQIWKLFVQPEVLFSTATNDVTLDQISTDGIDEIGKQRFNKFDIPVLFGVKYGSFKLGAGPIGTMHLNSKSDIFSKDELDDAGLTVGYLLCTGFDFNHFNIELRYEGNLSNIGTGVRIGETVYDFDKRQSQIILSTAFLF